MKQPWEKPLAELVPLHRRRVHAPYRHQTLEEIQPDPRHRPTATQKGVRKRRRRRWRQPEAGGK